MPKSDFQRRWKAAIRRSFPVGARVQRSASAVHHAGRHGPQWARGAARERGTVTGHTTNGVEVEWDHSRASVPDQLLPEDVALVPGSALGGAAAAAGSLAGAFNQAASSMGFQPPWGGAVGGLGAAKASTLPDATVATFNMVLVSKLTQYDQRMQKRQPNAYRMGHLLNAANKVSAATRKYAKRSDAEAMQAFLHAIDANFTRQGFGPNAKFGISAVNNVVKQVNDYLATGKLPSLTRR